jgi:sigma-E factor negative regulatory protein RseB
VLSLRYISRLGLAGVAAALVAASPAFAAGCPGADAEAIRWLDKMARSAHEVSYHGVVTFQRGGDDMQVMQVSHSVEGGTTSESLTQLTGQGAKVVRSEHPLECLHPGHRLLRVGEEIKAGNCGVAEHYRFRVSDGERVAGRKALELAIQPHDNFRYGHRLWLDTETGFLLKTELIGDDGQPLEQVRFVDITLDPALPPTALSTSLTLDDFKWLDTPRRPRRKAIESGWAAADLPAGFTVVSTEEELLDDGDRTVLHILYSDGLANVSAFVLAAEDEGIERAALFGASNSFSLVRDGYRVTTIGQVPAVTVERIARSMAPR